MAKETKRNGRKDPVALKVASLTIIVIISNDFNVIIKSKSGLKADDRFF